METNSDKFEIEINYPEGIDVDNRIDKILCDLSTETFKPKDIEITFTMKEFVPEYITILKCGVKISDKLMATIYP